MKNKLVLENGKEYLGLNGTIKYMFDDSGNIKSMAWLYLPESDEELEKVYADLCNQTNKLYGKSGFNYPPYFRYFL